MSSSPLRNIPAVNELLAASPLPELAAQVGHAPVVEAVRSVLDELRDSMRAAGADQVVPDVASLAAEVARRVRQSEVPALRPVINATGILLHTGLGRAPLAEEAVEAMTVAARGYASVELDLATGRRSRRTVAVEGLLRQLTGAEAALVVNNNAGATMLALAALAAGREVIVSRGQLIEIGGSYRLPEVMAASGAVLREVGTTNKTRPGDYAAAVNERTAALLLVHPSNFVVVGFAESVELADLAAIGRRPGLPVIHDIGSGALIDFSRFGFRGEPVAAASIAAGADVVLFSGDKLLGGPQCGVVLGRRELVERIERHPLARALRVDKLTLSALVATLRLYRDPEKALRAIPLLTLLSAPAESLRGRAERLADAMAAAPAVAAAAAIPDVAYLGGGSVPGQELETWCVGLAPAGLTVDQLAEALRTGSPAVVGRVQQDRLLLDLRTVSRREDESLLDAVKKVPVGC